MPYQPQGNNEENVGWVLGSIGPADSKGNIQYTKG